MWITNKLGYDITLSGVTLYKNSQQEISDADATTLNKDAVFTAMITAGTGLIKTDSQPDVNPQYFVRALDAPVTLDGMPTNPNGHPMVSPAQAFDIGKEEGGSADLENNKAVTIDVSEYTAPVEVTPTEGKDGMKKATVTLDNIPSSADLEANHAATINVSSYTEPVEIEPTAGKDGMEKVTVSLSNIPAGTSTLYAWQINNEPYAYLNINTAPSTPAEANDIKGMLEDGLAWTIGSYIQPGDTYAYVSDTEFTIRHDDGGGQTVTDTYIRDATKDLVIWP